MIESPNIAQRLRSLYYSWHRHPLADAVHWSAFVAIAVLLSCAALGRVSPYRQDSAQTAAAVSPSKTASHPYDKPRFAQDRILVKFKPEISADKASRILADYKLKEKSEIRALGIRVLTIAPGETPERVTAHLNASERGISIEYAEPDFVAYAAVVPNDQYYANQWHLPAISAPQAWDISPGSGDVIVAVVDSGIDATHPDLSGKVVAGYNFYDGDTNTSDVTGHGTAVAGVIAAASNNAIGVSGISWNAKLMPLRTSNQINYSYYSAIISALAYAADHGASVANVSIAGTSYSSALQDGVDYAWNHGLAVVAAAGNDNTNQPQYPAALDHVIAVSATDVGDIRASFSSYGSWVDVSAPGSHIETTQRNGTYGSWSGTSFAAPIIAGEVALAKSVDPSLSNQQLYDLVNYGVDDVGTVGFDQYFGWGRVDLDKSLSAVAGGGGPGFPTDSALLKVTARNTAGTIIPAPMTLKLLYAEECAPNCNQTPINPNVVNGQSFFGDLTAGLYVLDINAPGYATSSQKLWMYKGQALSIARILVPSGTASVYPSVIVSWSGFPNGALQGSVLRFDVTVAPYSPRASPIDAVVFDFGDGTPPVTLKPALGSSRTVIPVTHTYISKGIYRPSATVTDAAGATAASPASLSPVRVSSMAVNAGPDVTVTAGRPVIFDQSVSVDTTFNPSAGVSSYSIDFGTTASASSTIYLTAPYPASVKPLWTYAYPLPGVYTMRFTAREGDSGMEASDTAVVTVINFAPAP